ncbi:MAG TPA: aminoglycoside phosphotransferase family protein [Longimicrobiales bacterium]|nr:aminoglycoside phosphotransferase family protein [Longimicrobiales bacterium]
MTAAHAERLERELARLVRLRRPGVRLVAVERSRHLAPSSWAVEDLEVRLSDGSVVQLVLKDVTREAPGSGARTVKPARVFDPRREIWIYDNVLPRVPESAACWGTVTDEEAGIHWLLLERVDGRPLWEVGDATVWMSAAEWLGRFHAKFLGAPPRCAVLMEHDRHLHRWWFGRALALTRNGANAALSLRRRETLMRLAPLHRAAVERVMGEAPTLLHGEFYPANILVDDDGPERSIVPVDWEMAGVGPCVLDLAALTSGGWGEDDRAAFVASYARARAEAGAHCPPLAPLLESVEAARLLLAVQWLGWAGDAWRPPTELYTNWLEEAVRSADRLSA